MIISIKTNKIHYVYQEDAICRRITGGSNRKLVAFAEMHPVSAAYLTMILVVTVEPQNYSLQTYLNLHYPFQMKL